MQVLQDGFATLEKTNPEDIDLLRCQQILLLLRQGQDREAWRIFEEGLPLESFTASARIEVAKSFHRAGRLEDARVLLVECIPLNYCLPEARLAQANLRTDLGFFKNAETSYLAALDRRDDDLELARAIPERLMYVQQMLELEERWARSIPDSSKMTLPEILQFAEFCALRKRIAPAIQFYEAAFSRKAEMSPSERIDQRDKAMSWFACRRLREGIADHSTLQELAEFCVMMLNQQVDEVNSDTSDGHQEADQGDVLHDILEHPRYQPLRELANDKRVSADVRESLSQILTP